MLDFRLFLQNQQLERLNLLIILITNRKYKMIILDSYLIVKVVFSYSLWSKQ